MLFSNHVNVGEGFNSSTGTFTVKHRGLYIFIITLRGPNPSGRTVTPASSLVSLYIDNDVLAANGYISKFDNVYTDLFEAGRMAIVSLDPGQTVWSQTHMNVDLLSDGSFGGYLLSSYEQ